MYDKLIDAETWAFIRESESWYPPETATFTIAQQREIYDRMCRAFHQGYPAGVSAQDIDIAGVATRHYSGQGTTVVYCHGGGFVVGGLESHDDVCAEISAATGLPVVSVDYRLSPEHAHPAAYDDALAVATALLRDGPVILAGDSAGGNLAAAVSIALRGNPSVRGQLLVYPGLGARSTESLHTHANAPMLTRADVEFYSGIRFSGAEPPECDPTARPLDCGDYRGLAPAAVFGAECDPLCDDGALWAARLQAAGVPAEFTRETGLVHGYLRARKTVARAARSFDRICRAIKGFA